MEVRYSATSPSMRPQSPSAAPPLPPSALLERRRRALVDRAGKSVRAGVAAAAAEAEVRRLSRSKLLPTILARRAAPLARSAVNKAAVAVSAKLPKTLRVDLPRNSLCLASPLRTNGTRAKLTGLVFFSDNNGRFVKIQAFSMESGKYQVIMEDGRTLRVHPDNLESLTHEEATRQQPWLMLSSCLSGLAQLASDLGVASAAANASRVSFDRKGSARKW